MSLFNIISRVTLAGVTKSSSLNRFVMQQLHSTGQRGTQLRNLVVCSNAFPCWQFAEQERRKPGSNLCFLLPDLLCHQPGQQLRTFYSRGTRQRPQQDKPDRQKDETVKVADSTLEEPIKLGLFARFKKMYKEYWYVLVPVHCVTSVFWFGGFYYASTSGVDVIGILESLGVSEKLIDPVRDSSLGHIAIAYLLYKIATPARYTVTLGGTTVTIKYLVQWGYIKPMPTKAELVQMYKDKKENFQERIAEKKQGFEERKQQLAERKKSIMDNYNQYKSDVETTMKEKKSVTQEK